MADNDDDLCIPRSAMYKLVKELVPQMRLSSEAKDLIVTSCNEFIHLLATEANNVCEKQSKKLILPDHVLLALDNLGFSEYKEDCVDVMKQMQEEVDKRKKLRNKLDKPGIPEEELLRQQNLLFAEARKQQQMIETEEWSKVQQEAQLALQRQASCSNSNPSNLNNSSPNPSASVNSAINSNYNKKEDDDDNYD
ncbi:Dr1 [Brachionus plicatilis]|uniref:Protein Dr1 n=1 Tax=Brachionus plicatilis TaxID=10195 RepID=A0A3M7PQ75_BRAPC|nr:Dr1 [Brachionus plicatilis]